MSEPRVPAATPPMVVSFVAGAVVGGCLAAVVLAVAVGPLSSTWRRSVLEECRSERTQSSAVAVRTLRPGVTITEHDVVTRAFHPDDVPEQAIFGSAQDVIGRRPVERILPNEIVREERLVVE